MKLSPKRGNGGHVTSYTINVGSKEARDLGFLNEDGTSKAIQKTIDLEKKCIIIQLENKED